MVFFREQKNSDGLNSLVFLPAFLVVTIIVFLARPGKLCFSSLPKSDLCNGPKILKVESVKQNVLKESKRERN